MTSIATPRRHAWGRRFDLTFNRIHAMAAHNGAQVPEFDPASVRAYPWLPALVRAYRQLDRSLERDIAATGLEPACRKGCFFCCSHLIPVTPPEVLALALYARQKGQRYAAALPPPGPCVFLDRGSCGVYPFRPVACRRYVVFGTSCSREEVPLESRPHDVLRPSRKALLQVLGTTVPYYVQKGLLGDTGKVGFDFFAGQTFALHQVDWKTLTA